jgi:hypothetical protein
MERPRARVAQGGSRLAAAREKARNEERDNDEERPSGHFDA